GRSRGGLPRLALRSLLLRLRLSHLLGRDSVSFEKGAMRVFQAVAQKRVCRSVVAVSVVDTIRIAEERLLRHLPCLDNHRLAEHAWLDRQSRSDFKDVVDSVWLDVGADRTKSTLGKASGTQNNLQEYRGIFKRMPRLVFQVGMEEPVCPGWRTGYELLQRFVGDRVGYGDDQR